MAAIEMSCFSKECICATCKISCVDIPNHPKCILNTTCDKMCKCITCTHKVPMSKSELNKSIDSLSSTEKD